MALQTPSILPWGKFLAIVVIFLSAWIAIQIGRKTLPPLVESRARLSRRRKYSKRRIETLRNLVTDLYSGLVLLLAVILSVGQFVSSAGLLTFLGLFSAALGLGFRPLVSDYLSGFIFLFEDQYAIGEKVEIFGVQGTVEGIDLRVTRLRAPTGELLLVPNGEVRNVRNFARAKFEQVIVHVDIPTHRLGDAIRILEAACKEAPGRMKLFLEPPGITTDQDAVIGERTRLTVTAKAKPESGLDARKELVAFLHDELAKEGLDGLT